MSSISSSGFTKGQWTKWSKRKAIDIDSAIVILIVIGIFIAITVQFNNHLYRFFLCPHLDAILYGKTNANSTACKLVCCDSRPSRPSCDYRLQFGLLWRLCITSTKFYRRFVNTSCSISTDNIFLVYGRPFFSVSLSQKISHGPGVG